LAASVWVCDVELRMADDGFTLYITANTNLYKIKLSTKGAGW